MTGNEKSKPTINDNEQARKPNEFQLFRFRYMNLILSLDIQMQ